MHAALLPKDVIFDAMASERAACGIAAHHLQSFDQMLEHHLPNIIMERPEIVAETSNSIHVIEFTHVHIDKPVARTEGGFYDWIDAASAKATRHTYANPVIIDAVHRIYSNTSPAKEVTWETVDARAIDLDIQALERARTLGLPPPAPKVAIKDRTKRGKRTILDTEQKDWTLCEERTYRQVNQFSMPTMVRSVGCRSKDEAPLGPCDRGDVEGYCIVKGTEKTLQTQRRLHINRFYVFPSTTPAKWTWSGEIRACHAAKIRSTSTLRINVKTGSNGSGVLRGVVEMPYIDMGIPILAVCMVLGFRSAEEVAVCAATGGVLSGVDRIPAGSAWDLHTVHTTRLWVLSLLRDGACEQAHAAVPLPAFESMPRSRILHWIGEEGTKRKSSGDRAKYAGHLMANEFLPQLGLDSSPRTIARKGQFFAMMLWTLANVARGIGDADDRDHAGNRQYDTAGMLCATLARQHYRNFRKKVSSEIKRFVEAGRFVNVPDLLNIKRMTDGFTYAMSTGNWGLQKGGSTQTGVAQMLNRMNPVATQSHLRRVDTPLKREGKQAKPRQLHVSSYGHTCPAETPEGPACGLVEQFAQGVHVCQGHAAEKLIRRVAHILAAQLYPLLDPSTLTGEMARLPTALSVRSSEARKVIPMVMDHEPAEWEAVRALQRASDAALAAVATPTLARLLINGVMIGFVPNGAAAATALRTARRGGQLPYDVAVEENVQRGLLCVTGEAGGLRRPLFVLDAEGGLGAVAAAHAAHAMQPPECFWRALVRMGLVEYLSKHEEENMLVIAASCVPVKLHAPLPAHTHCEVHPVMQMGIAAAAIPFSDHNQAPRTSYFASMCKQTAGTPGPEIPYTNGLRLWYAQRPLVATWTAKIHGIVDAPQGINAWIVVAALDGKNQEDSLYMNEDSKNRGMFACSVTRTFTEDCQGGTGADAQHFEKPPNYCRGRKTGNYNKLGANGFVTPGEHVRGGDAIIGKTMDVNEMGCIKRNTVRRDQSVVLPAREKALEVDHVIRCRGRDDKDIVNVRTHAVRFLQSGDKLTSMHGQKGVVGSLLPARRMPYTADGIVADLVINPHALPSRMTIGQLIESALVGLVCGANGEFADGTPFNGVSAEATLSEVSNLLAGAGFTNTGEQVMYDGETGARIQGFLFYGCTYYQRVKQMVDDKLHARARGPVHILTQQPVEGRSKEGGFRMGDMERDCARALDGQVLTNRGFLFLDELLAVPREELLIAAYDPATKASVYEAPTEIVVNEARERMLVEFTHKNEASRWSDTESDAYGVALKAGGPRRGSSNQVSLVVTGGHDMYAKCGVQKSISRVWDGSVLKGKRTETEFAKMKASVLLPQPDSMAVVKFLANAEAGLAAAARAPPPYVHLLGGDMALEGLFLELHGYWLGDGSMIFQSGAGRDALQFKIVKLHDIAWLLEVFGKLGFEQGTHFTKSGPTGSGHEFQLNLINKAWVDFYFEEYRHRYPSGNHELKRVRGPGGSSKAVMDPDYVSTETRTYVEVSTSKSSFLRPDGVKSAKWFASWAWDLPKDGVRSILSGLRRADGSEAADSNLIYTSSSRFRDEIVRLSMHAGYAAHFSLMYGPGTVRGTSHRGNKIVATRHSWMVTYQDKFLTSEPGLTASTDIKEVLYNGRTWCVTVPHGHVFMRRAHAVDGVVTKASIAIITGNCIEAHGGANVAWDRFFQQSDYSEIPVCKQCCMLAMPRAPPEQRSLIIGRNELAGYCQLCKTAGTVYSVPMPYATKLFSMELMSAHIRPEFVLDVNPEINPYTTAAVGVKRSRPDIEAIEMQPAVQSRPQAVKRVRSAPVTRMPDGFLLPKEEGGSPPGTPPASPPYMPSSPTLPPRPLPASPPYMPSSPTSPPYMPSSPTYSTASSYYTDDDAEIDDEEMEE